ncbi:MtrAB system histidine kinase MtrB [Actinacidiphila acidipaludis]|uniref:Sensor histidine kinase MtrB n=1 Tax=Actinacidiphila acidipaludis TaxID=2873382 RepID=A0ABS7QIS6_9ACTN|nr:MtrAB system histidine kinase MtrB [Streptomyces acidipaludis]MBY8882706.1 HAMP domain-containing histidine kinase [Streptomyces acidipaludis]
MSASYERERLESRLVDPMQGLLPVIRSCVRWARRPLQPAVRLWRRNLQLRVVAFTLLMSVGVVLLLGFVVIGQVKNGLLDAKEKAAENQAISGFSIAQSMADKGSQSRGASGSGTPQGSIDSGTWLNNLVQQFASGGKGVYWIATLSPGAGDAQQLGEGSVNARGPRGSGSILPEASIPRSLSDSVEAHTGALEQYTTVYTDDGNAPKPALAIGKRLTDINGTTYQLYYLFPFDQEQKTLGLVKGTLATAGIFVVVLLGAIAWLVTRQVVTPVRMAAGIAERLAAGRLQERMQVTGEDDIARLGESFNKMAQNLQVKIQQLEDLSRMQRRFVSDVSHELRTPLTTVRMAADVIHDAREDFDPATSRSAELLQNQLDRFESLLSDLLEISRFDAGAAELAAEPIDLREVVRRVVEAAEPLAERKGSRVVIRGEALPVIAEADPRRVERVLRNLVVNAIEHGDGRDVVVRLATADGAVAVAVRDYGVGLKPGEATRVFNRFWRADPARARTTGGTGLGLSIAVEDARLHGGWLQAWGEPGGGSQFRMTLPRTAGDSLRGSPIPLEPEDSRRNRGLSTSGLPGRPGASQAAVPMPRSGGGDVPPQGFASRDALANGTPMPAIPPMPSVQARPPAADPAALPGSGSRVVGHKGTAREDDV